MWRRVLIIKILYVIVECLEEFKEYKFRVFVENFIGISEFGEESEKVVIREVVLDVDYDDFCK